MMSGELGFKHGNRLQSYYNVLDRGNWGQSTQENTEENNLLRKSHVPSQRKMEQKKLKEIGEFPSKSKRHQRIEARALGKRVTK